MKLRINSKQNVKEELLKEAEERPVAEKAKKVTKETVEKTLKEEKVKAVKTTKKVNEEKANELQAILADIAPALEKGCRIVEVGNGTVARVFTKLSKGDRTTSEGFICELNTSHIFGQQQAVAIRPEWKKLVEDTKPFGTLVAVPYDGKGSLIRLVKEIKSKIGI